MGRLQVRLDSDLVVVQLVQKELRRIVRVAADVELPTARLIVDRTPGVATDGGVEGVDVRSFESEFDDQG